MTENINNINKSKLTIVNGKQYTQYYYKLTKEQLETARKNNTSYVGMAKELNINVGSLNGYCDFYNIDCLAFSRPKNTNIKTLKSLFTKDFLQKEYTELKSIYAIAKKHNCTWDLVKYNLDKYRIFNGTQISAKYPLETINKCVSMFRSNTPITTISLNLNIPEKDITEIIKEDDYFNFHCKRKSEGKNTKHTYNINAFDNPTLHEAYYWIGFLGADRMC